MKTTTLIILLLTCLCLAKDKPKHHHKMALTDDLVAYWGFEHDVALFGGWDSVWPHSNTLVAVNFDASLPASERLVKGIVPIDRWGHLGNAVRTPGIVGSVALQPSSNSGISHQGGPFSVVFWYKPTTLEAPGEVLGGIGEWWVIRDTSGGSVFLSFLIDVSGANTILNVVNVPLVLGEWYFVAFGWDGSSRAWATVNLQSGVTADAAAYSPSSHVPFFWGNNIFDDVAIWRRSLSDSELRKIYNRGKGLSFSEWEEAPCGAITCCD